MITKKLAGMAMAGFIGLNLLGSPRVNVNQNQSPKPSFTPGIKRAVEVQIRNWTNKRGNILRGTVTAKDTTSITVDSDEKNIKVDITDKTQFRRLFWGKSSLGEITVGDKVNVIGKWVNEDKTEITAVLIRDLSVMKRFGVFFGEVKSLSSGGFVMTTTHMDDETVSIGSAKLINRDEQTITQGDIKVGDKVRVKGLWDATLKTITEVAQIKDFSLPAE